VITRVNKVQSDKSLRMKSDLNAFLLLTVYWLWKETAELELEGWLLKEIIINCVVICVTLDLEPLLKLYLQVDNFCVYLVWNYLTVSFLIFLLIVNFEQSQTTAIKIPNVNDREISLWLDFGLVFKQLYSETTVELSLSILSLLGC